MAGERGLPVESLGQCPGAIGDPRCSGKVERRLLDFLVIAVFASAGSWDDIALYGRRTLPWFRTFLELADRHIRLLTLQRKQKAPLGPRLGLRGGAPVRRRLTLSRAQNRAAGRSPGRTGAVHRISFGQMMREPFPQL